jgi:hypothetical protein
MRSRRIPSFAGGALAGALFGIFFLLNAISSSGLIDEWPAYKAERYYDGLRRSVADYRARTSRPPAILDEPVITEVLPGFLSPFNRAKYVLPTLRVDTAYNTPADALHSIGEDGSLVPLEFVADGPAVVGLLGTRLAPAAGSRHCVTGPRSLEWRPSEPVVGPNTDLRLRGRSNATSTIPVFVDETGQGFPPYDSGQIPTQPSAFSAGIATGRGTVHALRFDVPPRVRLCFRALEIGDWRPRT